MRDIVGLYLNPPDHAVVLCADEKSQVLDRTQRSLPLGLGKGFTHDCHGTTTLLSTGKVLARCAKRHHQEFLTFLA